MNVITIAQSKGGVGKSTLATNLACAAIRDGKQAVIVELDRQGTASNWAERRNHKPPEVIYTNGVKLVRVLEEAEKAGAEIIFIDLPGTHNPSSVWAIRAADFVLIPSRPYVADIEASELTVLTAADEGKASAFALTFAAETAPETKAARKGLESEGVEVAPGTIRYHKIFAMADEKGLCAGEMDAKSPAAKDVTQLWRWLKGRLKETGK